MTQQPSFCTDLMQQILDHTDTLKSIILPQTVADSDVIESMLAEKSLVSLSLQGNYPSMLNFSSLTNLTKLFFTSSAVVNFDALVGMVPNSLTDLDISSSSISSLSGLTSLYHLEKLTFAVSAGSVFPEPFPELPQNLVSLTVSGWSSTHITMTSFSSTSPSGKVSLRELHVLQPSNVTRVVLLPDTLTVFECACASLMQIDQVPQGLQSLSITSAPALDELPPQLGACTNLTTLSAILSPESAIMRSFPSLVNTNLTSLTLREGGSTMEEIETALCTKLPRASLSSLLFNNMLGMTRLPACLGSAFPKLSSLAIYLVNSIPGANWPTLYDALAPTLTSFILSRSTWDSSVAFDWDRFVNKVPVLEKLDVLYLNLGGTFPAQLQRLSRLSSLRLWSLGLTGTIPADFFVRLPRLTSVGFMSNALTGTFPWYGLQAVTSINLMTNQFSAFPSVYGGAPNLQVLNLARNQLTIIPDDISLSAMPKLTSFSVFSNPTLRGPVPAFWANHSVIQSVSMSGCSLEGPLPPKILSPHLIQLDVGSYDRGGSICGPLPEIGTELAPSSISIKNSLISGTIPESWSQNLWMDNLGSLDLHSNLLSGTFPSSLFSRPPCLNYYSLNSLDISDNLFSGATPNFEHVFAFSTLNMSGTTMDPCAKDPHLHFRVSIGCELPYYGAACACTAYWAPHCKSNSSQLCPAPITAPNTSIPFIPACQALPAREAAVAPVTPTEYVISSGQAIYGDFDVPSNTSVTFVGLSPLTVYGCLSLTQLTIQIDPQTIELITTQKTGFQFTAITFSNGVCNDTDTMQPKTLNPTVTVTKTKADCRRVSATSAVDSNTLSVLFKVDSVACRRWWIILVSVIGGIIIIAIITLVLLATFNNAVKTKIRPFWSRGAAQQAL